MKKCSTCEQEKSFSDFWKRSLSPDGLAYVCKKCDSTRYMRMKLEKGPSLAAKQKEWRDRNKKRIRDVKRKSKYGVCGSEIDRMRAKQKYACEICKRHESVLGVRGLVIDHCHQTKKIRGLLCDKCNRCLGLLNDCSKTTAAATKYLRKYQK